MAIQRFTVRLSKRNATSVHTVTIYVQIHENGNPNRIYRSTNLTVNENEFDSKKQRLRDTQKNQIAQMCLREVWAIISEVHLRNSEATIEDVRKVLNGVESSKMSIKEFALNMANEEKPNIAPATYKNYHLNFGKFCDVCGLDATKLNSIGYNTLLAALTKGKEFYSGSTFAMHITRLNCVFAEAKRRQIIRDNPLDNFDIRKLRSYTKPEVEYPKWGDLAKLVTTNDFLAKCAYFQLYTGISFVDLQGLTIADVKTDKEGRKYISKSRQKTKVTFYIRVSATLLDIITSSDFSLLTERQYNRYLLRTLGVTSHQFRHIFAIEMLNRGLSIETIAKLLGHNKTDTTLIYSPLVGKELSGDELEMVG